MFGELKDGLPLSLEALYVKVLGSGITVQHIAVGYQGKHLMDHQVMLHRNSVSSHRRRTLVWKLPMDYAEELVA